MSRRSGDRFADRDMRQQIILVVANPAGAEPMNRGEVVCVPDVLAAPRGDVHETCSKAVLHQVPESESSLFSVKPGARLAAHLHTRTWDLFFVISGSGEIRYKGRSGAGTVAMPERAFCAIPPGCEHEVCNLSATEPFSFLLIHAPWRGYDHVRTPAQASSSHVPASATERD